MRGWFASHRRTLFGALSRIITSPLANLLNIAVIGIALALPLGLHVMIINLQDLARNFSPHPQISIFLVRNAGEGQARAIGQRLRAHAGITGYRFVPRTQALADLQSRSGLGDVIAGLRENPLPDAYVVNAEKRTAPDLQALRAEFSRWPGVAEVHVDSDWARRLDSMLALGRIAVLMLGSALGLALIATTFNTIRLQILTQRDEIDVVRLIGATDAYVQRPFLYFGSMIGTAGGLMAWMMIWIGLQAFHIQLLPLADLYGIPVQLAHLDGIDSAYAILFAAGLGWCGAWLSVRRHIKT